VRELVRDTIVFDVPPTLGDIMTIPRHARRVLDKDLLFDRRLRILDILGRDGQTAAQRALVRSICEQTSQL